MADIRDVIKEKLREYRTEIAETIGDGNDLNWLRDRVLNEITEQLFSNYDSIIGDLANINADDVREKLAEEAREEGAEDVEMYVRNELEEKLLEEIDEVL